MSNQLISSGEQVNSEFYTLDTCKLLRLLGSVIYAPFFNLLLEGSLSIGPANMLVFLNPR